MAKRAELFKEAAHGTKVLLFKKNTSAFWLDVIGRLFYRQLAKSQEQTRYRYLVRGRKRDF